MPSYNSLVTAAKLFVPLQDNAASTAVATYSEGAPAADATLVGGKNTADLFGASDGPNDYLPGAMTFDGVADYINIPNDTLNGLAAFDINYATAQRQDTERVAVRVQDYQT